MDIVRKNLENMSELLQLDNDILEDMVTNEDTTLLEESHQKPVMLIFLRHFGCTFCREALADISKTKNDICKQGFKIIFVHMSDEQTADKYFERYDLSGSTHIADPGCRYYKSFGLMRGSFNQLFGLNVWMRGFSAGLVDGHGIGKQLGDGFQMPGVFLIQHGEVKDQFIHKSAADKPDYSKLLQCCAV